MRRQGAYRKTEEGKQEFNAYMRDYRKTHRTEIRERLRESHAERWRKLVYKCKKNSTELGFTFEEWKALVVDANCHYCKLHISTFGCSLDRKDSSQGYTKENAVPCCYDCNIMKNDILSYEEMCYLAPLLVEFRAQRRTDES